MSQEEQLLGSVMQACAGAMADDLTILLNACRSLPPEEARLARDAIFRMAGMAEGMCQYVRRKNIQPLHASFRYLVEAEY